jgi:hypothetical protein
MTSGTLIQNYLMLHLSREIPGLDVWRANVVGRKPGVSIVAAGEPGQANLTGIYEGGCAQCGTERYLHGNEPNERCQGVFIPRGRSVWIEVKSPGDSQTPKQKDFERRVSRLGALYIICHVRKRYTLTELAMKLARHPGSADGHPAEIAEFFAALRGRL